MFRKNTVFILGAGSNYKNGFYLSPGLMAFCSNKFLNNYSEYLDKTGLYTDEQKTVMFKKFQST
jgi:hypothetical protein